MVLSPKSTVCVCVICGGWLGYCGCGRYHDNVHIILCPDWPSVMHSSLRVSFPLLITCPHRAGIFVLNCMMLIVNQSGVLKIYICLYFLVVFGNIAYVLVL